ncbi:MAG: helix-turn-helix transcriptional regulator [Clostridia bacterium]|nr:helix-turn-helix transcriptional regulator [Clostridia bacterium]MDH7572232.1 helix-turn-helix transcriptional regulator [Clostridia bacterium]
MLDYRDALREELKDPHFKAAWDEFDLEYQVAGLLVKLRAEAGLSQEELARRIGTTQSAIARMESGKVVPRLESLAKIAQACGKRLELSFR